MDNSNFPHCMLHCFRWSWWTIPTFNGSRLWQGPFCWQVSRSQICLAWTFCKKDSGIWLQIFWMYLWHTYIYIYMHDICITYKTVSNRIEISNILCFLQPKLRILLEDTQVYVEEPVTPHASITRDGADCVTLQLRSWQLPYRKVLYLSRIWWRWQDVGIRQSCEDLGFFFGKNVKMYARHINT